MPGKSTFELKWTQLKQFFTEWTSQLTVWVTLKAHLLKSSKI